MDRKFFVGIGAQKSGTSWMGNYFSKHPQIGFSPINELHYFNNIRGEKLHANFEQQCQRRLIKIFQQIKIGHKISRKLLEEIRCLTLRLEMKSDKNKYLQYFDLLKKPEHVISGEITPAYSMLNVSGFKSIKNMFPEVKILFILRDPVDRYWSHLRFEETRRGIQKFSAEKKVLECLQLEQANSRTDYKRTLSQLYRVIPAENVCVVFYENIMDTVTHESELTKVTNFLGVDYLPGNINQKKNVSKIIKLSDEHAQTIAIHFAEIYEYIHAMFPDNLPKKWLSRLEVIERQ